MSKIGNVEIVVLSLIILARNTYLSVVLVRYQLLCYIYSPHYNVFATALVNLCHREKKKDLVVKSESSFKWAYLYNESFGRAMNEKRERTPQVNIRAL